MAGVALGGPRISIDSGVAAAPATGGTIGLDSGPGLSSLAMPAVPGADIIPAGKILALTGGASVIDAAVAVGSVVAVALLIIRLFRYAWDLAWKG